MSRREWKPGDVALRTSELTPSMISVVVPGCAVDRHADGPHWHHASGGWDRLVARHATYRPLVVLDPEDREQVERLISELAERGIGQMVIAQGETVDEAKFRNVTEALRSLIAPPKPDEPQGLGAVVEDAEGRVWVNTGRVPCWLSADRGASEWDEFPAVKVLSEGVRDE